MPVTANAWFRLLFIFIGLSLFAACKNDTEMVVDHNDRGQKTEFERRKKDSARHGEFKRWFVSGKIAETAFYQNDTLEGERKLYFESGLLERLENYKKGVIDGKYQAFRESGALEIEQTYSNGALNGWSYKYHPNGVLEEKVMLIDNEENGPFTEYYETGVLKAEGMYIYKDDQALEQGELKEYDSTGVLIRIADCQEGRCYTRWKKEE
jgi:antitoxin component YwqK of YwqJK toxin-antitoxin module